MARESQLLRERYCWSPDVVLFPVAKLDAKLRSGLGLVDDEYALNLVGKSQGSQILNRDAASLLQLFCNPTRIIDAVEELACSAGQPAHEILPQAIDLIAQWRRSGVLIESDMALAAQHAPSIPKDSSIGGYRVRRFLRSGFSTEVYLVEHSERGLSVLKISNSGHEKSAAQQLDREALVLKQLNGVGVPALLEHGLEDGKPFLRMEWLAGNEAQVVASKLRLAAHDTRKELLELCRSIASAYAAIHRAGVIHGDVHPRNVLVLGSGEIRIVDFGLSRLMSEPTETPHLRGGFPFFFEPEYAQAILQSLPATPPTPLGEQFALAALIYFLITGKYYLDFRADRETALRQILTDPMGPFSRLNIAPWPEVEVVLEKALAKDPAMRYASIDGFEAALRGIRCPRSFIGSFSALDETVAALVNPRHVALEAPSASFGYGAAGVAYLFRRAACVMDRPDLLAAAELWMDRAWKEAAKPAGFCSSKYKINDAVASPASLYYGVAGVHVVAALVGHTTGDLRPLKRAIEHFAVLQPETATSVDVISGSASALLGCALLVDLRPLADACEMAALISSGHNFCLSLADKLSSSSLTSQPAATKFFGAAHGWAGVLQAILRWHASVGTTPPAWIANRLRELASLGVEHGNSTGWPVSRIDHRLLGGWCHGAAGYVSLWGTAYQVFHDGEFMTLALKSAEHAWRFPERAIGQLCCGLVGQAESLLLAYRLTGDRRWIDRAQQFAASIDRTAQTPHSLMKGTIGASLLALDLAAPESSGIPLFDRECL
jgi:eukaryotic-like serine/threonine-protein kinase